MLRNKSNIVIVTAVAAVAATPSKPLFIIMYIYITVEYTCERQRERKN